MISPLRREAISIANFDFPVPVAPKIITGHKCLQHFAAMGAAMLIYSKVRCQTIILVRAEIALFPREINLFLHF